jgi:hypothetical protein
MSDHDLLTRVCISCHLFVDRVMLTNQGNVDKLF